MKATVLWELAFKDGDKTAGSGNNAQLHLKFFEG